MSVLLWNNLKLLTMSRSSSYTARVDIAIIEYILHGKLPLHRRICSEFIGIQVDTSAEADLAARDEYKAKQVKKRTMPEEKRRRTEGKIHKKKLLRRKTLNAGDYIYVTSDEQAVIEAKGEESDSAEE